MIQLSMESATRLPKAFNTYRPVLESEFRAALSDSDLPLYDMLRYHMGWLDQSGQPTSGSSWGKGLRPMMCLFSCEAVGGDWRQALPAAVALELVHNFSLIHDDIQDADKERRHRPTVWHLWGVAQGMNAGDSMRGLGTLALVKGAGQAYSVDKLPAALETLEKASLEMIEGQYLDISYEKRVGTTTDEYLDMISRKTGALIECALHLGALLGSDDPSTVEAFRRCGRSLGLVFQIRDDILGVWGTEESTGKAVAADIRRTKMCLPVVYALQSAVGAEGERLQLLYNDGSPNEDEVNDIMCILDNVRAFDHCQSMATDYCKRALDALVGLAIPRSYRSDLEDLATFFLERQH